MLKFNYQLQDVLIFTLMGEMSVLA